MTILERLAAKNGVANDIIITELKKQLESTDYKAIKFAEGCISEEEYAPVRAERQAIRDKINELKK